jgi:tetratricopeptide (TPR) repeat protein
MIDASTSARLALIAAENDDDATAAELYQKAQDFFDRNDDGSAASTIARHRLLAARRANDPATAKKELETLLAQAADMELDAAIDVVAYLRDLGRKDEAAQLFNQAYERQKARPAQNRATQLNNLAWLCARCGEKLPEAIEMSKRANRLEPDNAGYWDTSAEANFVAGNPDEAVKLESRALGLKANDRFMTRQLERFKQGAAKGANK